MCYMSQEEQKTLKKNFRECAVRIEWKPSLIIQAHLGGRLKKIVKLKSAHNIMSQKYSLVPYKSTG